MILIKNANVFDGKNSTLRKNVNVIIKDNLVDAIEEGELSTGNFETVIDAGGKTLMPGLTDSHVHIATASNIRGGARLDEQVVHGVRTAHDMLMRGFTSV